jgi:transcriptional regulator with XRE-family HTH domain
MTIALHVPTETVDAERDRCHWAQLIHDSITATGLRTNTIARKIDCRPNELQRLMQAPDLDSVALVAPLSEVCNLHHNQLVNLAVDCILGRANERRIEPLDRAVLRTMIIKGLSVGAACKHLGVRRRQLVGQILAGVVPGEQERLQMVQRFINYDDEAFDESLRYTEARSFARTAELDEDTSSLRDMIISHAEAVDLRPIAWGLKRGLTGGVISNILVRAKPPRRKHVIAKLKTALALDDDRYRAAVRVLILEGHIRSNKKNVLSLPIRSALQEVIRNEMDEHAWRQRQFAETVGISESTVNRILKQEDFVPREIVRLKLQKYFGINAADLNHLMTTRVGEGLLDNDIQRLLERATPEDKQAIIRLLSDRLDLCGAEH